MPVSPALQSTTKVPIRRLHRLSGSPCLQPCRLASNGVGLESSRIPSKLQSFGQNESLQSVAILGGGISGLATTFYLLRSNPFLPITIYEKSDRLGGWIRSSRVNTVDGSSVLFEAGPRTIRGPGTGANRYNALNLLQMVHELGIDEKILYTKQKHSRYVLGSDGLQEMPKSLWQAGRKLRNESFFRRAAGGLRNDLFAPRRPPSLKDETIQSFFNRRFSRYIADNFVSALVHGIYAGDISELSMRSVFPGIWDLESFLAADDLPQWLPSQLSLGSIVQASLAKRLYSWLGDPSLDSIGFDRLDTPTERARKTALKALLSEISNGGLDGLEQLRGGIWALENGMETLIKALEEHLARFGNVTILKDEAVRKLETAELASVKITSSRRNSTEIQRETFSHVLSSIPPNAIASLSEPSSAFASDSSDSPSTVSVAVTNLYFGPDIIHENLEDRPRGFGYLIPCHLDRDQNPYGALGVVFDSDILEGAMPPPYVTPSHKQTRAGISPPVGGHNMTVMMGGHHWKRLAALPSEDEVYRMVRRTLEVQLGIPADLEATVKQVVINRNCIPQYRVGHADWVEKVQTDIKRLYKGRLQLVGGAFNGTGVEALGGVGVSDCVRAAREAVAKITLAG